MLFVMQTDLPMFDLLMCLLCVFRDYVPPHATLSPRTGTFEGITSNLQTLYAWIYDHRYHVAIVADGTPRRIMNITPTIRKPCKQRNQTVGSNSIMQHLSR